MNASWNDETSATTTATSSVIASINGRPMFPAAERGDARLGEHRRHQGGDRGLAVRPGDRHERGRAVGQLGREVDLGAHRQPAATRLGDGGMALGDAGARHDEVGVGHHGDGCVGCRRLQHACAQRLGAARGRVAVRGGVRRSVLEDDDRVTARDQVLDERLARERQPDHDHGAHQSITPGMLM